MACQASCDTNLWGVNTGHGASQPLTPTLLIATGSSPMTQQSDSAKQAYTPPRVWSPDTETGGRFASINRPTAGATHEKTLPLGKHPLQLYSLATPNGVKVTILLEELLAAGHDAEYDAWPINILEG